MKKQIEGMRRTGRLMMTMPALAATLAFAGSLHATRFAFSGHEAGKPRVTAPKLLLSVTNTADSGSGSLRDAIALANANTSIVSGIAIDFAIPTTDSGFANGVYTIKPASALPAITAPNTEVDGSSQTGYSSAPIIVVDGSAAPTLTNGFTLSAAGDGINALVVDNFGTGIGIDITGAAATGDSVTGCYVGTDASGNIAASNNTGIEVESSAGTATIGGSASAPGQAPGNVVSANTGGNILIGANANLIAGNLIGPRADGTNVVVNGSNQMVKTQDGIDITGANNVVGGATTDLRNIISGNQGNLGGIVVAGSGATGNTVEGNYIGTAINGTTALPNSLGYGIFIVDGAANNTIGGVTNVPGQGPGNLISGNNGGGIGFDIVFGPLPNNNTIVGNAIGVDANGLALPNTNNGIFINAQGTIVGTTTPGNGNLIASNTGDGIEVNPSLPNSPNDTGNSLRGNSILGNTGLGINLQPHGEANGTVTANDSGGDLDSGPNDLLNFPIIASAALTGNTTAINGILDGPVSSSVAIDFYSNDAADPSGHGQGKTYIGSSAPFTTVASGVTIFNATVTGDFVGKVLSATTVAAADGAGTTAGDTSEFGPDFTALARPVITSFNPLRGVGGEVMTINGSHFTGATSVQVNFALASNFTVVSDTAITAILPTNVTTGPVRVTTPGGTGVSAVNFTVTSSLVVTNTADIGPGSLRDAMNAANLPANAGSTITFNIPTTDSGFANGVYSIAPHFTLPQMVAANTTIDGTTQPGYISAPIIVIDGTNASVGFPGGGFFVAAPGCQINGLVIDNFHAVPGVDIFGPNAIGDLVTGCYIGVDATGSTQADNGVGVRVESQASDALIGGPTEAAGQSPGNVISGNVEGNIVIDGSNGNVVAGNFIGLRADGTDIPATLFGQAPYGIGLQNGASNNIIGGSDPSSRNVVSWSTTGLSLGEIALLSNASNNTIEGNFVNTLPDGQSVLPFHTDIGIGISDGAGNNLIGGNSSAPGAAPGNIIASNNGSIGIVVGTLSFNGTPNAPVPSGNSIKGNTIGFVGPPSFTRGGQAVEVMNGATNTTIGSISPGDGNLISNNDIGISVQANTVPATGVSIRGNSLFNNTFYDIQLVNDPTNQGFPLLPNDPGDADSGPNDLQNYPVLLYAGTPSLAPGGPTVMGGTLNSAPNSSFVIDFYTNPSNNPRTDGPGTTYIGSSSTITTDANGNANFSFSTSADLGRQIISALAVATTTGPLTTAGDTSEFGPSIFVDVQPTIASIYPTVGPVGTAVTIHGFNFGGPALGGSGVPSSVTFNGVPATSFTLELNGDIQATVPVGATTGPIVVTAPGGVVSSLTSQSGTIFTVLQSAVVENTNDSGPNSLRQAIVDANATPGTTIAFNIPLNLATSDNTNEYFVIAPSTPLPAITANGTIVDGSTENGIFGHGIAGTTPLPIETGPQTLNMPLPNQFIFFEQFGTNETVTIVDQNNPANFMTGMVTNVDNGAGTFTVDVTKTGGGGTIASWFAYSAGTPRTNVKEINIDGGTLGNAAANDGLQINADNCGVNDIATRHFSHAGVAIIGTAATHAIAQNNFVTNSWIGTDQTGTAAAPNGIGVYIGNVDGTSATGNNNTIGDATGATSNIVSGNINAGVSVDVGGTGNAIYGNFIGTDGGGDSLGNGTGISIAAASQANTIGKAGQPNTVAGNTGAGIVIDAANSNVVANNFIGTDAAGGTSLGNGAGIDLDNNSQSNVIGSAGLPNTIAGNTGAGIDFDDSTANTVVNNFIGNFNGTTALPNGQGVVVEKGSANNQIGDSSGSTRNIISGNTGDGILIDASGGNIVSGANIGLDASGLNPLPNANGIVIQNAARSNQIGGTSGARNFISANAGAGIEISGSIQNVVAGNALGVDSSGLKAQSNAIGISIDSGSTQNTIGAGNQISGNTSQGILISGGGTNDNTVEGNKIGTDLTGNLALANGSDGVLIGSGAQNNTIGLPGFANVISGNVQAGIHVTDAGTTGNIAQSDFIGTNAAGTSALGNGGAGIALTGGSIDTQIGGAVSSTGNVIAGQGSAPGIVLVQSGENEIIGNSIGTNQAGSVALANGDGIDASGSVNNFIGGNLLSGNSGHAIYLNSGSSANLILGNFIGVDGTHAGPLPNGGAAIRMDSLSNSNAIGYPGSGNIIADNGGDGVLIAAQGGAPVGNSISANSIFGNKGLGINLQPSGEADSTVTPNDLRDLDTGPNNLQNYPIITSAIASGGKTVIKGNLNTVASTSAFNVELFSNANADPSGFGQGQVYLGDITGLVTDINGNAPFSLTVNSDLAGKALSATAIASTSGRSGSEGDTSEFGPDFIAVDAPVFTGFSPASGAVGQSVTITGENLTNANTPSPTVQFAGANSRLLTVPAASVTKISAISVTVTVPNGAVTGPISVTTSGGTAMSPTNFTVVGVPIVSSFAPSSGSIGATVTITGYNFVNTTTAKPTVTFGTLTAVVSVASATSATVTVPSGAVTGPIGVTTSGGAAKSGASFAVVPKPAIASFTPASASVGATVTIVGTNLTNATTIKPTVTFGGVAAVVASATATDVTAAVPNGAISGKIAVTTSGGTATSAGSFTVVAKPLITSIMPSSGSVGSSVTVMGTNLTNATTAHPAVMFGTVAATVTAATTTSATVTVPNGALTGLVTLTTSGGTSTSPGNFTVVPRPFIVSINPSSGSVGALVTIAGTAFTNVTTTKPLVTFGTVAAVVTAWTSTSATVTVPPNAVTAKISLATSGGSAGSAGNFTVVGRPTIGGFTPSSAPIGTIVTLTGANFTNATTAVPAISFGTKVASVTSATATSAVVKVPAGAVSGKISVTTSGGTAVSAASFTVTAKSLFGSGSGISTAAATVAGDCVRLTFTSALDGDSATASGNYAVTVNGAPAEVESAGYRNGIVTIGLAGPGLKSGDQVVAQWQGLMDAKGVELSGQIGPMMAR